jgi:hypothetical protein
VPRLPSPCFDASKNKLSSKNQESFLTTLELTSHGQEMAHTNVRFTQIRPTDNHQQRVHPRIGAVPRKTARRTVWLAEKWTENERDSPDSDTGQFPISDTMARIILAVLSLIAVAYGLPVQLSPAEGASSDAGIHRGCRVATTSFEKGGEKKPRPHLGDGQLPQQQFVGASQ